MFFNFFPLFLPDNILSQYSSISLSKKLAETPHLNIEYRWGMNAVNASDREIWSKK